jgi:acetate kinase
VAATSTDPILVVNTGSSTFKWALFAAAESLNPVSHGGEEWTAEDALTRRSQIEATLRTLPPCRAVGHRVVHGGAAFRDTVAIDDETHGQLESLVPIDPLHMRAALCGIDAARAAFPSAAQFAVFDTAFHRTMSEAAAGYALPAEWTRKWGLQRYGFHGLSVAWSIDWVRRHRARVPGRIIVAHLGSGCSVTAARDGQSIDTTMGFTPLEGLMMGTRSGSVDPGLLIHLQSRCGVSLLELEDTLTSKSGLLGVSGVSADMRKVIAAADEGNANAALAYERFIVNARRGVGAMAGMLGGADMLIFTGGIGEHEPRVRHDVAEALGSGLIDLKLNELSAQERTGEGVISAKSSAIAVLAIRAREDVVVLREVLRLLAGS